MLTLRDGADNILSRWPDFCVGGVHGVKQEPVLIASLQHQWLSAKDGDAVPLLGEKKQIIAVLPNCADVTFLSGHIQASYLEEGVFKTLQGGPHSEVSDGAEPVQQDNIVYKSSLPPGVLGCFW